MIQESSQTGLADDFVHVISAAKLRQIYPLSLGKVHCVIKMKIWLATRHFRTNEDFNNGINSQQGTWVTAFFNKGLQILVQQYTKCLLLEW